MSVTIKISAIQDELAVFDTNTVETGSEEQTFSLDISAFSIGAFQCKIEGKDTGRIKYIAPGIVESEDNIPFGLSSYTVNSVSYAEIASWYLQKFYDDCDTLKVIIIMEA